LCYNVYQLQVGRKLKATTKITVEPVTTSPPKGETSKGNACNFAALLVSAKPHHTRQRPGAQR